MPPSTPPSRPWLVACWPGMGNVATIAANVLIAELGLEPILAISPAGFFDISEVHVVGGRIEHPRMPRSVLHRGTDPATGRTLLVFVAEAQPTYNLWAYANGLLDKAAEHHVERVFTFASMASTVHPTETPKVHGAATNAALLEELERAGVTPVDAGQIGGLNGVLLGAAMDRGLPGLSLLGEIPFYAANLPNPKASRVVLSVFSVMAGLDVSLAELDAHAKKFEGPLTKLYERLREQAQEEASDLPDFEGGDGAPGVKGEDEPGTAGEPEGEAGGAASPEAGLGDSGEPGAGAGGVGGKADAAGGPRPIRPLSPELRSRIERLFEEAGQDRTRAMSLKEELDRLGVFEEFEDRFLDLFKRAE